MKIKYEIISAPAHGKDLSQTPCPFYPKKKVGSLLCAECEFFCEEESTETEVECTHEEKK